MFVRDENRIGKLVSISGRQAIVRLRHSAVKVEERTYPLSQIERGYLYPETRVFFENPRTGELKVGRVRDFLPTGSFITYTIKFPNGEVLDLEESVLETRTLRPNPDPTDALAAGYSETQFFHDRRKAVQQVLIHARRHSGGLNGLLSASVKLLPHQVAVVWRILSDPIQRYLLADEVGMGKTIEAGAILRQVLMDDDTARVVVAAPTPLVRQWEHELRDKFHLDDFGDRWRVVPFTALEALSPEEFNTLVLDEAHHLVSPQNPLGISFEKLAQLAHSAQRLYMLTATPVLGDAEETLRLLHLLDKQMYPLDDLPNFRKKLERREQYGRILISLTPGLRGFPLSRVVKNLLATFPDDEVVAQYVGMLQRPDATQEAVDRTIRSLKRYLMETYRLHQRLIRSRRKDLEGWELLPREAEVRVETDLDADSLVVVASALEDWRDAAQRYASEQGEAIEEALVQRYVALFEALGEGVDALGWALKAQLEDVLAHRLVSFPEDEQLLVKVQQVLRRVEGPESKYEALKEVLVRYQRVIKQPASGAVKCVVFTTTRSVAEAIATYLGEVFGPEAVFSVLSGYTPEVVEQAVNDFREAERFSVLVCDRSGEEGLNLQFASAVIHFDVPLDPARLEQRIGRVDRFGRKELGVRQTLLVPTDDEGAPWLAWYELLENGFALFSKSLSDVQFHLASIKAELARRLFRFGPDGLARSAEWVREALAQERDRLDAQYALDALAVADDDIAPRFSEFAEGDAPENYQALDRWLVEALHFYKRPLSRNSPDVFILDWNREEPTLLPKWPWKDYFDPVLRKPHTYCREAATGADGIRLVRPGSLLVSNVERILRWEDRGSSFATWRVDPRWPAAERGPWYGFSLTYIVEFDVERALDMLRVPADDAMRMALRRRADALFRPWMQTVILDGYLEIVTDPLIQEILAAPYRAAERGGNDYNLGSRQEDLFRIIPREQFRELCYQVSKRAREIIRSSPEFQAHVDEGIRRAEADLAARKDFLRYRQERMAREDGRIDPSIAFELRVIDALLACVREPHIRLDAIGCFIVSDEPPLQRRAR